MKKIIIGALMICLWSGQTSLAYAQENDETAEIENQILSQLDTEELEAIIGDVFIEDKITFAELLHSVLYSEYEEINEMAYQYIVKQFFYELSYNRATIIHILLLTIFASVFTNFSNAFGSEQIASMGFYILYLMLLIITLQSFQVIIQDVTSKVNQILVFMSALCPVYFLTVAISNGTNSAVVFYNLSLLYIYVVELVILSVVIPMVNSYVIVEILNYLTTEKRLSKLAKLIKMMIHWVLKIVLAGVIGLNVIQGLIAPTVDEVQRTIWLKGAESIPVVGDALSGTGEVILGTMKLIKNGVGVVGLILCIGITLGPAIQMCLLTFMYKFVAAAVEPISDKRISSCLYSIGEGCQMLLRIIIAVGLLFLITIALVAATTS